MTAINGNLPRIRSSRDTAHLTPPAWVNEFVAAAQTTESITDGLDLSTRCGANGTLVSVRLRDAIDPPADRLEARTITIYQAIRNTLSASPHPCPVRVWNYIPRIHQRMDEKRDRYMVFNAGRFKEYCDWFGGPDKFPQHVPTASGVGHRGTDLVVHCLATTQPGIAIENPRQIPAFGYSKRYGPLPPCFARATLIPAGDHSTLLVGGTASIVGEQSTHLGALDAQTTETLTNLAAVVQAAAKKLAHPIPADREALAAFVSLRIYNPNPGDRPWIESAMAERFGSNVQLEFLQADLCRSELLVEIEGVARL